MWMVPFVIIGWLTVVSGNLNFGHFKGCASPSFVKKYDFYYMINQPLSLEESLAVCNHRLTKYIGLQVDKSNPDFYTVYCGNDLFEMSPKLEESRCQPCPKNRQMSCGQDESMSVYLLRESTPLAILIITTAGVEILVENTTSRLTDYSCSSNSSIDYIYTDDAIFFVTYNQLMKTYYNTLNMKFSQPFIINSSPDKTFGLAVDFWQRTAFWGYDLVKTNLMYNNSTTLFVTPAVPSQISVDVYNRSLVFLMDYPSSCFYVYLLDEYTYTKKELEYLHIDKINAITLEVHEKLLYAAVTLKGDSENYLVNIDYKLSRIRVLFTAQQLINAVVLEVFKGDAVWLRRTPLTSTIYMCKLLSRCKSGDIASYTSSRDISDFTIFHPEKQTPGEKWLCANLTCQYGCKASSLFSASCSCPPGMERNSVNNSCYELTSTSSDTSAFDNGFSTNNDNVTELTSTSTDTSAFDNGFSRNNVNVTNSSFAPSTTEVNTHSDIKADDFGLSFNEAFIVICIAVILLIQIVMCVLIIKKFKTISTVGEGQHAIPRVTCNVQEQSHELNEYVEIPFRNSTHPVL